MVYKGICYFNEFICFHVHICVVFSCRHFCFRHHFVFSTSMHQPFHLSQSFFNFQRFHSDVLAALIQNVHEPRCRETTFCSALTLSHLLHLTLSPLNCHLHAHLSLLPPSILPSPSPISLFTRLIPTAPCCCIVPTAAPLPRCHQAPLPVACN